MRNRLACPWARALLLLSSVGAGGCMRKAAPPRPPAPSLVAVVRHALGSPVDPAGPAAAGPAAGEIYVLRLDGYAAVPSKAAVGEPLAGRGGLIIDALNEPAATAPPAAELVRLVVNAAALPAPVDPRQNAVATVRSLLPPGCTAVVSFAPLPRRGSEYPEPVLRLGIVSPSVTGTGRPRLLVTAKAEPVDSQESGESSPANSERTLLLDWPLDSPTGGFALLFPADPPRGVPRATVWRIRLDPAEDDPVAARDSARIVAGLSGAGRAVAPSRGRLLAAALAPSNDPAALRHALLSVCAEVRGEVGSEAALLLDDKSAAGVVRQVAEGLAAAPPETDTDQLGWLADRALIGAFAKLAAGGDLAAAEAAMLSARFGEAGRDPAALGELAAASPARVDFETRVRAENLILLEDASPASRVRAFEWMSRRNDAPKGYDPLAPSAKRRPAIDQYLQLLAERAQAMPSTHPSNPPQAQPSTRPEK